MPPARPGGGFFVDAAGTGGAVVALTALYVFLEWLSSIHEYNGLPITPWNPGLGVAFAVMMHSRAIGVPMLFVGMFVAETMLLESRLPWARMLGISGIVALSYGAVAAIVERRVGVDVGITRLRDVVALLAAGGLGAVATAALLTLLLFAAGHIDPREVVAAATRLLLGDFIGIAVIAPLLLRFRHRPDLKPAGFFRYGPEAAAYLVVVFGAVWAILRFDQLNEYHLFHFLFLPIVLAAVRHGLDGACLSLALTQCVLVWLLHRYDYDAHAFIAFQALMLVLTVTGLTVGAVVSERRIAEAIAAAARAALEDKQAEAAQAGRFNLVSGMASALAHEINQPLTALRARARSAEALLRGPQPDTRRAGDNIAAMVANIDHASDVLRRVRDFVGRNGPVGPLPVEELIADALALVRPEARDHGVAITVAAAAGLPPVPGHRTQIQQVLINLIHNAVEASGRGGRVAIAARLSEEAALVEFSVADSGPGIAPEVADRLFTPLTTTKPEGLGLGLAICRSIVEAHGGRIWLAESRPGATEFRFSLPAGANRTAHGP